MSGYAAGQQQQLKNRGVVKAISGAADNGSQAIRITCANHTFRNSDPITISGVVGTTEANKAWTCVVIDANHFDLKGSRFTHPYVSGGQAKRTQG